MIDYATEFHEYVYRRYRHAMPAQKIALFNTLHALRILQYQLPIILREAQYVGKRRERQMKRQ